MTEETDLSCTNPDCPNFRAMDVWKVKKRDDGMWCPLCGHNVVSKHQRPGFHRQQSIGFDWAYGADYISMPDSNDWEFGEDPVTIDYGRECFDAMGEQLANRIDQEILDTIVKEGKVTVSISVGEESDLEGWEEDAISVGPVEIYPTQKIAAAEKWLNDVFDKMALSLDRSLLDAIECGHKYGDPECEKCKERVACSY